jgi:hypothetical protein
MRAGTGRDLRDEQRRRAGVAARVQRRTQDIATQEVAVAKGEDPTALVALRAAQEFDRQSLAVMDGEIAALELAQARAKQISALLEADRIAETARARLDAERADANAQFSALVAGLAAADLAFTAARADFLRRAAEVAPIHSDEESDREPAEALRQTLLERGATLTAVSTLRPGLRPSVFTMAAGAEPPLPEPWGSPLQQAVEAYQRDRGLRAYFAEEAAPATVGATT